MNKTILHKKTRLLNQTSPDKKTCFPESLLKTVRFQEEVLTTRHIKSFDPSNFYSISIHKNMI